MPGDITFGFLDGLLHALLNAAFDHVQPNIPRGVAGSSGNTGLADTLQKVIYVPGESGALYLDQYWAVYVHDGTGVVGGKLMIYFRNPLDDPRLNNGVTPNRASDLRHMTTGEFQHWVRINRLAVASGSPPPMVVIYNKGAVVGSFFFENNVGMSGFMEIADKIVDEHFRKYVNDFCGRELDVFTVKTEKAGFKIG